MRYRKVLQDPLESKYKWHVGFETLWEDVSVTWDNSPVKLTNAGWARRVCIYDSNEGWKFLVLNINFAPGNISFSIGNAGAMKVVAFMKTCFICLLCSQLHKICTTFLNNVLNSASDIRWQLSRQLTCTNAHGSDSTRVLGVWAMIWPRSVEPQRAVMLTKVSFLSEGAAPISAANWLNEEWGITISCLAALHWAIIKKGSSCNEASKYHW